jgi:hypothetical protein
MSDGAVYNLPPFRPRPDFPEAGEVGKWLDMGHNTLSHLAKSLDGAEGADPAGVGALRSVPDPWAQVRAFADALLTDHHPQDVSVSQLLHDVSVSQWRGLLALFGLQGLYDQVYSIDLTPVNLGPLPADAGRDDRSLFARVMTRLLPRSILPQTGPVTATWFEPVVAQLILVETRAEHVPFAILNPGCLIAPARTINRVRPASIPWMADGLTDPTTLAEGKELPAEHYYVLQRWLGDLLTALKTIAGDRLPDAMTKAIQSYQRDCGRHIPDPDAIDRDYTVVQKGAASYPDGLAPLYKALAVKTVLNYSGLEPWAASDCLIKLRDDLTERCPLKGVILFDPAIADTLEKRPQKVVLWGAHRLSTVEDGSPAMRKLA